MGASTASDVHSPVITRFAPSPTGYLHIGGVRTALFNYLFARHHGGKFLLRIEDTDRARSTDGAIAAILDGLSWLNLDHDDEIVYQFSRAARHAEVAHQLLAAGHAYRCYATAEELEQMRDTARAERRPMRYDGRWRDRTDGPEGQPPEGQPHVIRLKAPQTGDVTIDDKVQGPVTVANAELDDMVLLRSDGSPTYMLAVVVDDHDMGVTNVIRGDDHLNNAFRQLALIRAMGWPEPVYAHIPLIHGADGAKLSKRHGALGVEAYRDEMGILPEALENYLLRLGWGHGDDEFISREQATEWFSLEAVGRGPSRLDTKKLEAVNGHYLRAADDARLVSLIEPRISALLERPLDANDTELLHRGMAELKKRAPDLNSLAASTLFYLRKRPILMDDAAAKLLTLAPAGLLARARAALADVSPWQASELEMAARGLAEKDALKLGQIAQPLRAALTGAAQSPGLFDVMETMGREEALGRLDDAISLTH